MNKNLEITKVNPNKTGGFVVTFKQDEIIKFAGIEKKQTSTYYMSVAKAPAVGTKLTLDMSMFNVKEYPFLDENGDLPLNDKGEAIADEQGNALQLKWLHLK